MYIVQVTALWVLGLMDVMFLMNLTDEGHHPHPTQFADHLNNDKGILTFNPETGIEFNPGELYSFQCQMIICRMPTITILRLKERLVNFKHFELYSK